MNARSVLFIVVLWCCASCGEGEVESLDASNQRGSAKAATAAVTVAKGEEKKTEIKLKSAREDEKRAQSRLGKVRGKLHSATVFATTATAAASDAKTRATSSKIRMENLATLVKKLKAKVKTTASSLKQVLQSLARHKQALVKAKAKLSLEQKRKTTGNKAVSWKATKAKLSLSNLHQSMEHTEENARRLKDELKQREQALKANVSLLKTAQKTKQKSDKVAKDTQIRLHQALTIQKQDVAKMKMQQKANRGLEKKIGDIGMTLTRDHAKTRKMEQAAYAAKAEEETKKLLSQVQSKKKKQKPKRKK